MGKELDYKNRQILELVQENGKITAREIGRKIGMPKNTVISRLGKLKEDGYIIRVKTVLNPSKLNQDVGAFVLVKVGLGGNPEQRKPQAIAKEISELHGVQVTYIVAGQYDIIVRIRGESVYSIGKIVTEKIRTMKNVTDTFTCFDLIRPNESLDLEVYPPKPEETLQISDQADMLLISF